MLNVPLTRSYLLPSNVKLACGERAIVRIEERCIALFNVENVVYAIDDSCPHSGASLAGGKLDGHVVQCPAHGLRFNVETGCMQPKTGLTVCTYPVALNDGNLVVTLPASDITRSEK